MKSRIISLLFICTLIFAVCACNDSSSSKQQAATGVVSGTIAVKPGPVKKNTGVKKQVSGSVAKPCAEKPSPLQADIKPKKIPDENKSAHYNPKGKIDPFMPLLQEKAAVPVMAGIKKPTHILTPLEKIELSQIRLVAVIIMKKRQLAMVEDASGKGYEVKVGTFIGKNQGRISEIRHDSIIVRELIRDYRGRLKERVKTIKLHKNDNGE